MNLCPAHQVWLGPPVRAHVGIQYDVSDLPETLHAQRRHYRLVRRHGRRTAANAFAEATHITALWARHGFHLDRRKPLIDIFGHALLTGRLPPDDPSTGRDLPRTVDLAYVLATSRWRHPTVPATKREIRVFRHENQPESQDPLQSRRQPLRSPLPLVSETPRPHT